MTENGSMEATCHSENTPTTELQSSLTTGVINNGFAVGTSSDSSEHVLAMLHAVTSQMQEMTAALRCVERRLASTEEQLAQLRREQSGTIDLPSNWSTCV